MVKIHSVSIIIVFLASVCSGCSRRTPQIHSDLYTTDCQNTIDRLVIAEGERRLEGLADYQIVRIRFPNVEFINESDRRFKRIIPVLSDLSSDEFPTSMSLAFSENLDLHIIALKTTPNNLRYRWLLKFNKSRMAFERVCFDEIAINNIDSSHNQ